MLQTKVPIMLVEDDAVDRELVRRQFQLANIANPLHMACDGVEALELLEGGEGDFGRPALLLLDINMPRMNGFELLEALRGDEKLRRNIVFVLSTSHRPEDVKTAYDLSAAGYFRKDDMGALVDVLTPYCQFNQFPPCT